MHALRLAFLTVMLYAPLPFAFSCSVANKPADISPPAEVGMKCPRPMNTLQDCGACNAACAPAHADGAVCKTGSCDFDKCKLGYLDCDGKRGNGCEVDGDTDTAHCGACGKACKGGEKCIDGTCCGNDSLNCKGMCVDPMTDVSNCGKCGANCPGGTNADPACKQGMCSLQCKEGFADCGGDTDCETNTTSDKSNCGECNKACPAAVKATVDCKESKCIIASCTTGFDDCDKKIETGCEADLGKPDNCGMCGNKCMPTEGCIQGNCSPTGVFAFGEFRKALKCSDFSNNGGSYQKFCFALKGAIMCTGQFSAGKADCIDTPQGVSFVYDYPNTWPMRFTLNDQICMNYHPSFIKNFALAIGYANYTVKQTKTGNGCPRSYIDDNGKFQSTTGDANELQIYEIEYFN
jgi:hypothetical protein